eukprot:TRINITY_DN7153_c0_g1_i1.p1 TRINITY_DN7153_c0_g1~~TRINITY_DN7153_c0_g1_i1.p1  ORF type:complete len:103 (-),score=4.56 TRINITY_DN7153_c0_g1_i1:220-528(-)
MSMLDIIEAQPRITPSQACASRRTMVCQVCIWRSRARGVGMSDSGANALRTPAGLTTRVVLLAAAGKVVHGSVARALRRAPLQLRTEAVMEAEVLASRSRSS